MNFSYTDLVFISRHWRGAFQSQFPNLYAFLRTCSIPARQSLRLVRRSLRRSPASAGDAKKSMPSAGSVVTIDGIRLRLHPSLSPRMIALISGGYHVLPERRLVLSVLEETDTVMELGGGIGMLSIACAQVTGSERVFSYEANPELEPLVAENYALNGVSPTMNFCILGETPGECRFNVSKDFWESSVHRTMDASHTVTVPVKAFNEEIARIRPTFLIIDIEGGEADLLRYADLEGVKKILLEVHPRHLGIRCCNALRRQLRQLGFAERTEDHLSFLYIRKS